MKVAAPQDSPFSLGKVEIVSWSLLLIMAAAGWVTYSPAIAKSILVGGLLANVSFRYLKKDLLKVMAGPLNAAKVRFFIRYYIRLMILAVVLYFLIRYRAVNVPGMLIGLSTVVLSILFVVSSAARQIYLTAKEAA